MPRKSAQRVQVVSESSDDDSTNTDDAVVGCVATNFSRATVDNPYGLTAPTAPTANFEGLQIFF